MRKAEAVHETGCKFVGDHKTMKIKGNRAKGGKQARDIQQGREIETGDDLRPSQSISETQVQERL